MEAARTSETSVDNYFTRQYIPEDKYELDIPSSRLIYCLYEIQFNIILTSTSRSSKFSLPFSLNECVDSSTSREAVSQLVKKFPAFSKPEGYIIVFTKARQAPRS
jgi:hypothetical protein